MEKNTRQSKNALYFKKLLSKSNIAVYRPIIALAIKNPSAYATRLSSESICLYTKNSVIMWIKAREFKAPIGVPFLRYFDVLLVKKFDFLWLRDEISLATPPTNKINVPIHNISEMDANIIFE